MADLVEPVPFDFRLCINSIVNVFLR